MNRKGALNSILGGWRLTGNFNAQRGLPLLVTCPSNELTNRCSLIGNPQIQGSRSKAEQTAQWINPAAFEPSFGSDQTFWANYDPTDDRAWVFGTSGLLSFFNLVITRTTKQASHS